MSQTEEAPDNRLSDVLIALFKGILYRDSQPQRWQALYELQARVRDYVRTLNLELVLDEAEGYAYLRQGQDEELPRLVPRHQLSFRVSLLLALLRRKLAEHDATGGDPRLILDREEIVDLVRVFLPDTANEARLMERVDADIKKVVEMGFLRRLKGEPDKLEVRRILKAFVDAQWLEEFDRRLEEYRQYLAGEAEGEWNGAEGS
jgi:hypothetical protein